MLPPGGHKVPGQIEQGGGPDLARRPWVCHPPMLYLMGGKSPAQSPVTCKYQLHRPPPLQARPHQTWKATSVTHHRHLLSTYSTSGMMLDEGFRLIKFILTTAPCHSYDFRCHFAVGETEL